MLGAVLAVPARLLPVWGLSIAARTGAASSLTIPISTIAVVVLGVPAVAATGDGSSPGPRRRPSRPGDDDSRTPPSLTSSQAGRHARGFRYRAQRSRASARLRTPSDHASEAPPSWRDRVGGCSLHGVQQHLFLAVFGLGEDHDPVDELGERIVFPAQRGSSASNSTTRARSSYSSDSCMIVLPLLIIAPPRSRSLHVRRFSGAAQGRTARSIGSSGHDTGPSDITLSGRPARPPACPQAAVGAGAGPQLAVERARHMRQ